MKLKIQKDKLGSQTTQIICTLSFLLVGFPSALRRREIIQDLSQSRFCFEFLHLTCQDKASLKIILLLLWCKNKLSRKITFERYMRLNFNMEVTY